MPGIHGNVHSLPARIFAWLILVGCVSLALFCGWSVQHSPHLGIKLKKHGNAVVVAEIEQDHLTLSGIQRGDTVLAIQGRTIEQVGFLSDPDLADTWKERDRYVEWKLFLARLVEHKAVELTVSREGHRQVVQVPLLRLDLGQIAKRLWPLFLVGFTYLLISWLIWRQKRSEAVWLNFISGVGVFISCVTTAAVYGVDVAPAAKGYTTLIALNAFGFHTCVLPMYLVLVFPTESKWVTRFPWIRIIPIGLFIAVVCLYFMRLGIGPLMISFGLGIVALLGFPLILLLRLFSEKDPLAHRQMKWVTLGGLIGFMPFTLLSAIPQALGFEGLPTDKMLLFSICTPFCLYFAITRYRLLDVGQIFDSFLVHGVTLGFLSLMELLIWQKLIRHFQEHTVVILALSMTLIVFVYAPLRWQIERWLTTLLGKERIPITEAIQMLLEKNSSKGNARIALQQTLVECMRPFQFQWIVRDSTTQDLLIELNGQRKAILGLELKHCPKGQESCLWAPLLSQNGPQGFCMQSAVVSGWSRSDLEYVSTLVHSAEPLLQIQELDQMHKATREALIEQREEIIREMHDGLGSQLFGLSLLAQIPEQSSAEEHAARIHEIREATGDAIDSLRTGLTVLSSPPGAFGPSMISMLMRAEQLLSKVGIQLTIDIDDESATLQMKSHHIFSLLRASQEGITNIVKHSKASKAKVQVHCQENLLAITISDNGQGFLYRTDDIGHGLKNLTRRMQLMNGRSVVSSNPGQGTSIRLEIPL